MNKNKLFLVIIINLMITIFSCNSEIEKTSVLVIGTIHGGHHDNPNYSIQDLINILGTFNPDIICVEIPPSYFQKRSYLKEMMIATIYGFDNKKQVYPIDWIPPTDSRSERTEYMKTDEYKIKKPLFDSLMDNNTIMQNFVTKYGELENIWSENISSYEFFNGEEYNDFTREMYSTFIKVFGDGCMNLDSEKRNSEMMALIDSVLTKNQGKKIIVLTGAEHKYYFDIELSKRTEVKLVNLHDILPLEETPFTNNISEFINKNLAKGYYDVSDELGIDVMYRGALVPLIHGLYMDDNPNIVPIENITEAASVVAEWEELSPKSVELHFEKAWIKFLEKDYKKAIEISESISDRLDEITEDNPSQGFILRFFWRNLGFCYDMVNERDKALDAYQQCRNVCNELKLTESYAERILKDFENVPYNRE